jgi:hypothetical protein
VSVDPDVIDEYANLIRNGIVFPPVRVWFDGNSYWLSDGFQRIAASEQEGITTIAAEITDGTLDDAKWDSYTSNSCHGLRRSKLDTELAIKRALAHPNAATMSNVQIAKHLGIPEPTLRRWRKRLAPANDQQRVVTRVGGTYTMQIREIGHGRNPTVRTCKGRAQLEDELQEMKKTASEYTHCILNILGHWLFGIATPADCLRALENVAERHGRL